MSVEKEILEYLSKKKSVLKYKGIRTGFLGLPDFKHYKYQTLANKFSSLHTKGLIKRMPDGEYIITMKGRDFLTAKSKFLKQFNLNNDNSKLPKDLLIIYDIPEDHKTERDWFRLHLKKFHFIMIQRSVWVGPSPLPKEFLNYIKEIKLGDNFKTFKLEKGYDIK